MINNNHTFPFLKVDNHFKEVLKGSFLSFILKIIGMLLNFVFIAIITRNYGSSVLGMFALLITIINIISMVGRLGLDISLVRLISEFYSNNKRDIANSFYVSLLKVVILFSSLLTIILFLIAPLITKYIFMNNIELINFRLSLLAVLPLVIISINMHSLRALKKIKSFTFLENISNYLFAIVLLYIFTRLFSKIEIIPLLSFILSIFITMLISHILWSKNSKLLSIAHKTKIKIKDLLNLSLPILFSNSILFISQFIPIIILGIYKSNSEVGIFHVIFKISSFTGLTLIAVNSIIAPKISELFATGNMASLSSMIEKSSRLVFWSSFPILSIIYIFPSEFLGIFGNEFKDSVLSLSIIMIGQVINAMTGSVGLMLQMIGKEKVLQNILIIDIFLIIIINLILIPKFGVLGAAIASTVGITFWKLFSVVYLNHNYGIKIYYIPLINLSGNR